MRVAVCGIKSAGRWCAPLHVLLSSIKYINSSFPLLSPFYALLHHPLLFHSILQIKMSLQLYRVDDTTYLLDFRHLPTRASERLFPIDATIPDSGQSHTHTLEFFELCALFISVRNGYKG